MAKISQLPVIVPEGHEDIVVYDGARTCRAPVDSLRMDKDPVVIAPADIDAELGLGADDTGATPAWLDGDGLWHAELADQRVPQVLAPAGVAFEIAADDGGAAPAWLDGEGLLHAVMANPDVVTVLTAGEVIGFVDVDGYALQALDTFGDHLDATKPFTAYMDGDDIAVASETGTALVTYGEGAQKAMSRSGTRLSWLDPTNRFKSRDVMVQPDIDGLTRLLMLPIYGQSNSVAGDAGMRGLDVLPLNPRRALMFSTGGLVIANATEPEAVKDSAFGRLTDLTGPMYDGNGAMGPRAAQGYLSSLPTDTGMIVAGAGVRGRKIAELTVGTIPFRNLVKAIHRASLQAWAAGVGFAVPALVYVQGESDFVAATVDGYAQALATLRNGIRDETRGITRDASADPVMLLVQPSSWTMSFYNLTTSAVPLAQMKAMLDDPARFAAIGPMYHLEHEALGLHLTSIGNRRLDEMAGDALARLARGAGAAGLHATGAVRNGTTVTVTCRLPEGGALAIDTVRVTDPGQLGLVYRQADGSAVAISNIAVAGDKITFTLASAVPGALGFALEGIAGNRGGPTSGPRCPIRDQFAAVSADGQPRFNWMMHHRIAVA